MSVTNRTYVYIDGFNLYYGCLKHSQYKWLNLAILCDKLLPKADVQKIFYFTAIVKPRPDNPQVHIRQSIYLRALSTEPRIHIVRGQFLSHEKNMRLAKPYKNRKYARVIVTEEKGSDVNIATWLMFDASRGHFDTAVVVSNDSDLVSPIKFVTKLYCKKIGLIFPSQKPSNQLREHATFIKQLRTGVLGVCQFPSQMKDSKGQFHKPSDW